MIRLKSEREREWEREEGKSGIGRKYWSMRILREWQAKKKLIKENLVVHEFGIYEFCIGLPNHVYTLLHTRKCLRIPKSFQDQVSERKNSN